LPLLFLWGFPKLGGLWGKKFGGLLTVYFFFSFLFFPLPNLPQIFNKLFLGYFSVFSRGLRANGARPSAPGANQAFFFSLGPGCFKKRVVFFYLGEILLNGHFKKGRFAKAHFFLFPPVHFNFFSFYFFCFNPKKTPKLPKS